MSGFKKRTDYCNLSKTLLNDSVTINGFVQKQRALGGLIFIDVRDMYGITQCVFEEGSDIFSIAESVRTEFVVSITGVLRERASKNPNMRTGDVEILAEDIQIISKAITTPFEINDSIDVNDALKLKYRYLDLRRPSMQEKLLLRHKVCTTAMEYFSNNGFINIETPMLTKSTPEGARDYVVPSRMHNGKFYALPQSPQQYKQMLMLSGIDRYFQITKCFRDEDLRADRQPEFTQIDLEMAFVDIDDVISINEGFIKQVFKDILNVEIHTPIKRITYNDAMNRYGSDKPDVRFGFEFVDITDIAAESGFKVFSSAALAGGLVKLINVKDSADKISRKEIDKLADFVKDFGAGGVAWLKCADDVTSSFAKMMTEDEISSIMHRASAEKNDLILVVAHQDKDVVYSALGALRIHVAKKLNVIPQNEFNLIWVVDFPLLELAEGRYVAKHHPFTAPVYEDIPLLKTDPASVRAMAYDIILNGVELGGGSIRISDYDLQMDMFAALGFTPEEAQAQFGHLLEAFKYGAPPHGGLAYGLDRLCMILSGSDSIRDVIAFPKVQNASELLTSCPDYIDDIQLHDLGISVNK